MLVEITELAGCDRLTITSALLKELQENSNTLLRKLVSAEKLKLNLSH